MTNKVFNLITEFKSTKEEDSGLYIEGMASTNDEDRIGDVIEPTAWGKGGLTNFKKNPIILFNHNHDKPIGRATEIKVTDKGLKIKAFISRHAPDGVFGLIKDGILGAFSVGFLIKDADYIEETGGLLIKAAELFENSVVSVPMNQSATFSLAKSFDSVDEYEEFKKTFTNRGDLAGQSLAGEEINVSNSASDTLEGAHKSAQKEIKMDKNTSNTPDLEAIAKKAAEETAAKIAMDNAKKAAKVKAAAEAIAAEKEKAEKLEASVDAKVSTGVENLVKDMESKMTARDADINEIIKQFKTELEEKTQELTALHNSKRFFTDRTSNMSVKDAVKANADAIKQAHLLGIITNKGWNTDFGRETLEKAGLTYEGAGSSTGELDQEVKDLIQKEIWVETKVASLFREIPVNGRATVLPLQTDTGYAAWANAAAGGNLENRPQVVADTYHAKSKTMLVDRMISSTFIDNDTDEKTLVGLLPMLFQGVARAHARTVEGAILYPTGQGGTVSNVDDIENVAVDSTITNGTAALPWTANMLMGARGRMGKYGLMPSDIAYVVSMQVYYDLINDPEFQNLNEVGDMAAKLRGVVGGIFGSPVIVSEEFPAEAVSTVAGYVVNHRNYVIPRLRGISVESDYETMNQRNVIVASQSLGFTELFAGTGIDNAPVVSFSYDAT